MKPCNNQHTYRQLIQIITSLLMKNTFISEPIHYAMCYDQCLLKLPQQDYDGGKFLRTPFMW